jgi:hypothetical protein
MISIDAQTERISPFTVRHNENYYEPNLLSAVQSLPSLYHLTFPPLYMLSHTDSHNFQIKLIFELIGSHEISSVHTPLHVVCVYEYSDHLYINSVWY